MPTTLNKPAGLPVFAPHDDPAGDCLLARLLRDQPWRRGVDWPEGFEAGIAHRLDNATSGAVLVADSLEELERLRRAFREHQLTKTYLMQAAADVPWNHNVCEQPIAHHPRRKSLMVADRGRRGSTPHRGKWFPARTRFRRIAGRLWEVVIETGVMHQIRVHAAFVGLAILGDKLYGGGELPGGEPFRLHHAGLSGPEGLRTDPVPEPAWAGQARQAGVSKPAGTKKKPTT